MSTFGIYLWTRIDTLIATIGGCIFTAMTLAVLGIIVCVILHDSEYESEKQLSSKALRVLKISLIWLSFLIPLKILVPTQKDLALMFVIPTMAQSETFNTIKAEMPEVTKLAIDALKETLKPEVKENKND